MHSYLSQPAVIVLVTAMLFLSSIAIVSGKDNHQQLEIATAAVVADSTSSNNSSSNMTMISSSNTQKSNLQITIDEINQLPSMGIIPNATSISEKCERNNTTGFFSQDCERKFIGKTNSLGQIVIFNNTSTVIPLPPRVSSYVVVTVTENSSSNNNSRPVANAIVDGTVSYTTRFAVDAGTTTIKSALVHALKPKMSDWTYVNWTAPES